MRRARIAVVWIPVVAGFSIGVSLPACGGGDGGGSDAPGADGEGGGGDATGGDGATGGGGEDAPTSPGSNVPELTALEARVAGATGSDLHLKVVGADADGDAAALDVTLLDAAGAEVLAFHTDLDGGPDSGRTTAPFDPSVKGQKSFIGTARLAGVAALHPEVAKVSVAVRDEAGNLSDTSTADVAPQPVKSLGEGCDPAFVLDRCDGGLGCRGTPPTCQEGLPPEIEKLGYVRAGAAAKILIAGSEPEDDLGIIHLEFLDAAGKPILVDLDNDEVPESDGFDVDGAGQSSGGSFFVSLEPAETFDEQVPQIAATPSDLHGHTGERVTAKLGDPKPKSKGQTCDPRGFDACATDTVCWPGTAGKISTCTAVEGLREAACQSAPLLDPAAGASEASGSTGTVSLWDAPPGCTSGDVTGRPEGVVRLHLESAAAKLTVTTALPGTNFDTVVYVLATCDEGGAGALGCADEFEGRAAGAVEMTFVPAGDYVVVVDSWSPDGGSFHVSAAVE